MSKMKLKVDDLEERIAPSIILPDAAQGNNGNGGEIFAGNEKQNGSGDPHPALSKPGGGPWSIGNDGPNGATHGT